MSSPRNHAPRPSARVSEADLTESHAPPPPSSQEVTVSAPTHQEALAMGLRLLGLGLEAVQVHDLQALAHEDVLPGAEALPGVTLRLQVRTEVVASAAMVHLHRILDLMGLGPRNVELVTRRGLPTLEMSFLGAGGEAGVPRASHNEGAAEDVQLLVGRDGQTLDALQHLLNRMVARGREAFSPPPAAMENTLDEIAAPPPPDVLPQGHSLGPLLGLDCSGWRERRLARLEESALRAVRLVQAGQRREVPLEPMPPPDRRFIHHLLKGVHGVHTTSRGDERVGTRHVVVLSPQLHDDTFVPNPNRPHRERRAGEDTPKKPVPAPPTTGP